MREDDADPQGNEGNPVIATLLACAVLVAAAVAVPRLLPPYPLILLVGAGIGAGLLLWLIALATTTRRAGLGWIAGSLILLLGAGALAGLLAHRQYEASGRSDPSSFAEIEFGPNGAPILPADIAARGPISRLFAASVQADAKERRDYADAMGKLGLGNLNSPYLLAQNPQTLANCANLDGIRTMVRAHSAKRAERQTEMVRAIDVATLEAGLKDAIREMALAPDKVDAVLENQLAGLDATAELCTLLAKRSWYNANSYFGFNSAADMSRYKGLQALRAATASEAERLDKAAAERMKAGQEKLRAALS